MSKLLLSTPLEAAHDAARTVYPLDAGVPDGDVMALRASALAYGPQAIDEAERIATRGDWREIALGMAAVEEVLALEASFNRQ